MFLYYKQASIPKFDDAKVEIISGIPKHIDKNYKYLDGIKIKNMKYISQQLTNNLTITQLFETIINNRLTSI